MFQLNIQKQTIRLEGKLFDAHFFRKSTIEDLGQKTKNDFELEVFLFLKEWFSDSATIKVKTSGSTGTPKDMNVEKKRMMQSAVLTCSFLNLKPQDKALLCMPMQYIAGKMVVVRSLVCGLDLYPVTPSGNPFKDMNTVFDFAALVPLQVFNTLAQPTELKQLKAVKNLIIGGGAVDSKIEAVLKDFPYNVYSTYGMTETLSHIALRKINGEEASSHYIPFSSVTLSLSEDNTLIIDAPLVAEHRLHTNDVVEMTDEGHFRIVGRVDNIINTGGIKVQTEEVERVLKDYIDIPFAIASLPDTKFGEIIVLVSEQYIDIDLLVNIEPNYYIPKKNILIDKIPMTETSKIDRTHLKKKINTL